MSLRTVIYFPTYYFTMMAFGIFGLALGLFSLLTSWMPPKAWSERFFQRLIHRHFAAFHWWCSFVQLLHVRYLGFERIPPGGLVLVANHPAMIDITCLLARIPEAVCIFKPSIRRNPVLGATAQSAGYLGSDGGHRLVHEAVHKVTLGYTLIVFPEGTRTPPGRAVLPFKPGFVLIAKRARVPIQLLRITTDSDVLAKGGPWWRLPKRLPAHIEVAVGPLISPDHALSTAAVSAEIEAWFRAPQHSYEPWPLTPRASS